MKKFISVLFTFVLFLGLGGFKVGAESNLDYKPFKSENVKNEAQIFLKKIQDTRGDWIDRSIDKTIDLYDFDNNLVAYLFTITKDNKPNGYIISSANPDLPGVIEFTTEGTQPYYGLQGKYIYVGPLMYYVKKGNKFTDIKTSLKYEVKDFKSKGPLARENAKKYSNPKVNNTSLVTTAATGIKTISGVPDYTWRKGCVPTSSANLLVWWDTYVSGKSSLVTVSGSTTLIDTLASYMQTNSNGGTTIANAKSGLSAYIGSKGFLSFINSYYLPGFSTFQSSINVGKPNLVTTANHPTYEDHCMTGVGYDTMSGTYIDVHDTWNTTPKEVWLTWNSYFDYVITVDIM